MTKRVRIVLLVGCAVLSVLHAGSAREALELSFVRYEGPAQGASRGDRRRGDGGASTALLRAESTRSAAAPALASITR